MPSHFAQVAILQQLHHSLLTPSYPVFFRRVVIDRVYVFKAIISKAMRSEIHTVTVILVIPATVFPSVTVK